MLKARPKIHFASMVGIDFDSDLFSWWLPYYTAFRFDSYTAFLHSSSDTQLNLGTRNLFHEYNFKTVLLPENVVRTNKEAPGEPDPVRRALLEAHCKTLPESDFLITADADEIQDWPNHPRTYLERGIRIVLGEHVDCFDETLHAPRTDKTLDENYPIRARNLSELWRPEAPLNPRKICMAPVSYPVDFGGSHDIKRGCEAPYGLASGPIDVLHYRWRSSAFLRVKGRSYWPPHHLDFIRTFFSEAE